MESCHAAEPKDSLQMSTGSDSVKCRKLSPVPCSVSAKAELVKTLFVYLGEETFTLFSEVVAPCF